MTTIIILFLATLLCFGSLILLIIRDRQRAKLAASLAQAEADRKQREAERKAAAAKRAAQEAENRRRQEAEAQQAAKVAAQEQKRAEREKREAERKAAAEAKHLEAMRRREELHQQKMRQLAELQAAQAAVAPTQQPDAKKETTPSEAAAVAPVPALKQPTSPAHDGTFAGQTVAFTGTLPNMSRAEAVQAVRDRGGKAFAKEMPAGTTMLVVGRLQGDEDTNKLRRADQYIGQIRKITAEQFIALINTPSK